MVVKDWLNIEERNPNPYSFKIKDAIENSVDKDALVRFCGGELINAVRNLRFLEYVLQNNDLKILSEYVRNNVFAPDGSITWVGDFGEVLCASILRDYDKHRIPIYKLRSREKKEWSMRLTDILTYKNENDAIIINFSEVKTRTKNKECDAPKAYEKLQNEMKDPKLEIIDFIQRKLYDEGKFAEAKLFLDVYLGKIKTVKYSILFLVYEKQLWNEQILTGLNDIFDNRDKKIFEVRIIRILNLIELIQNSYQCAKDPETLKRLIEHAEN
jgi:hypothetical protein